MTATPRLYSETSKAKAKESDVEVWSMDDEEVYGKELFRLGFGRAVELDLLTDYKVLVLGVNERFVAAKYMAEISNADKPLTLNDTTLTIGCWNGLAKILHEDDSDIIKADPDAMRRAVAFTNTIDNSKLFCSEFQGIIGTYKLAISDGDPDRPFLDCQIDHVDGNFDAASRTEKLDWLKADTSEMGNVCRVLSNARCLSEGVDVPTLDAVIFLSPRNSTIDIVQSVGRVMRKDPTGKKKFGYIILPVGIPAGVDPAEALRDSKKYKIIWDVLQALRAHDDRFNSVINKIDLNRTQPANIKFIGVGFDEEDPEGSGGNSGSATQVEFQFDEVNWRDALYARMVVKCGDRDYWDRWAQDVAKIAQRHADRIRLLNHDPKNREIFDSFVKDLRGILNPSISEDDAIEMLSQHLITKPVFDALFERYEFTKHNPISKAMQGMLDLMEGQALDKETESLDKFYESVKKRVSNIDILEGKQKILTRLYDEFFSTAFSKMTERLGIVYTPIEVVEFIIHSADYALKKEFGVGIADKGVNVIDPFTGTGTFIVRLLQSGLFLDLETLKYKYENELHANEIVLLAYYLAAINIEETYHSLTNGEYLPFNGIVLTDTFQLAERQGEVIAEQFTENAGRIKRQKAANIQLIVGNPPYSVGQDSANDNNQNMKYEEMDRRIATTYAALSTATNKNSLYDSYIRAFRWASDRIGNKGIVCFVTNGGYIDGNAMDGFRKSLIDEFSSIYCLNLRGNARTSGERRRRERDNVFGQGTRTPVAILMLIKNPEKKDDGCTLYYHDIGDYLTRKQKLDLLNAGKNGFGSIERVHWDIIEPNESGDWIEQRNEEFMDYISLGNKKDPMEHTIFSLYSAGVKTNRDPWTYNFSHFQLSSNIKKIINTYNEQVRKIKEMELTPSSLENVIDRDPTKISWSGNLTTDILHGKVYSFRDDAVTIAIYRPYCRQRFYYDQRLNERTYQMLRIFPNYNLPNTAIYVSGIGAGKEFSALIVNALPNLHMIDTGQCFPMYLYEQSSTDKKYDISEKHFFEDASDYTRRDNISDEIRDKFRAVYNDITIGKEDIFYYVYGILHSPTYRQTYESDLKKMLPRIPFVKDFWGFNRAGRELAHWHLNYETIEPYPLEEVGDKSTYRVEKMRFGKVNGKEDKSVIVYNSHLDFQGIPLEAYEYVVNGKPALEWIMERYAITTDKASGIKNDPNEWAKECGDERYIPDLVKRIVRVSLETVRIVRALPELEIIEDNTPAKPSAPAQAQPAVKQAEQKTPKAAGTAAAEHPRGSLIKEVNSGEMMALSIKQPWASLIAIGRKTIEFRSWRTSYRGKLLICASKTADPSGAQEVRFPFGTKVPLGAAVCVVDLVDCRRFRDSDAEAAFMPEDASGYAWVLSSPRPIEPFAVRGKQGLFMVRVPEGILF